MKITAFLTVLIIYATLFSSCSLPARTGEDIYSGFFGKPTRNCVQIKDWRDARALDDCCVWLHFKTCPAEVGRIFSQVSYSVAKMNKNSMIHEYPDPSSIDESLISSDPPKWWIIRKLGDSCLKYEYRAPDKDYIQLAYVSFDSTEVFYHDISW